jgi:iron complex transport system substrate-binding protein
MMRTHIGLSVVACLTLALAACGNSSTDTNTNAEKVQISTTDRSGNKVELTKAPSSVAALSPGDAEVLLELDANVVGVPTMTGVTPDNFKGITEIGNPHTPSLEKIAQVHADVFFAQETFKQYAPTVENQGSKVVYTKADSIEDIQQNVTLFGDILQKEDEAKDINEDITEHVQSLQQSDNKVRTLLVYGAPGTFLAALPSSLVGDILEKAGGENVAADFPKADQYPNYASMSTEKIIEANPQIVMLITHSDPEAVKAAFEKEMKQNAAWKNLDAVKEKRVVVLSAELFGQNPGTKITEALDDMKKHLDEVR